jgi:hypothetical protein
MEFAFRVGTQERAIRVTYQNQFVLYKKVN